LREVEQENNKLKNDHKKLKFVLDCENDAMNVNIKKWGVEKNTLSKEVKKLEHKIAELLKYDDKHNAKLNKIKTMRDE
jgi:uncharacterized coiled-coil DUF342 family protein